MDHLPTTTHLARSLLGSVAFVGALMSRESAMVLPMFCFSLIAGLLVAPASLLQFIKALFGLWNCDGVGRLNRIDECNKFVFYTTPRSGYAPVYSWYVLLKHMSTLAFPWGLPPPLDLFWSIIFLLACSSLFKKGHGACISVCRDLACIIARFANATSDCLRNVTFIYHSWDGNRCGIIHRGLYYVRESP